MLDKAGCLQRLNVRHSMSPTTPVIKVSPHNNQVLGGILGAYLNCQIGLGLILKRWGSWNVNSIAGDWLS